MQTGVCRLSHNGPNHRNIFLNATYTDVDNYTQPTISKFYECWIPTCTHSYIFLHITSVCEHCRRGFSTNRFLPVDFSTSYHVLRVYQPSKITIKPTNLSVQPCIPRVLYICVLFHMFVNAFMFNTCMDPCQDRRCRFSTDFFHIHYIIINIVVRSDFNVYSDNSKLAIDR